MRGAEGWSPIVSAAMEEAVELGAGPRDQSYRGGWKNFYPEVSPDYPSLRPL